MKSLFKLLTVCSFSLFMYSGVASATGEEPPPPTKPPLQGCTPGYWKNHVESWVTFTPYQAIDVFEFPSELYAHFVHVHFIDGLSLSGGSKLEDAAYILMRHALAAMLNMRHPDVNYPLDKTQVRDIVNAALASLDRDQILAAKDLLEGYNELGCPL